MLTTVTNWAQYFILDQHHYILHVVHPTITCSLKKALFASVTAGCAKLCFMHDFCNATELPLDRSVTLRRLMMLQDIPELLFTHMLQGNTCLHVAACLGSDDVVHTLLENGADPNIGDDNVSLRPCRLTLVMHVSVPQHVIVCIIKSCVHGRAKLSYAHKSHGHTTRL